MAAHHQKLHPNLHAGGIVEAGMRFALWASLQRGGLDWRRAQSFMGCSRASAYRYLAESIRRFPPQAKFAAMIGEVGLDQVKVRNLSGGIAAMHSAWRL